MCSDRIESEWLRHSHREYGAHCGCKDARAACRGLCRERGRPHCRRVRSSLSEGHQIPVTGDAHDGTDRHAAGRSHTALFRRYRLAQRVPSPRKTHARAGAPPTQTSPSVQLARSTHITDICTKFENLIRIIIFCLKIYYSLRCGDHK